MRVFSRRWIDRYHIQICVEEEIRDGANGHADLDQPSRSKKLDDVLLETFGTRKEKCFLDRLADIS